MFEWLTRANDLERRLKEAHVRGLVAVRALGANPTESDWEKCRHASDEALSLERQVAAVKREQYAESVDFPVKWNHDSVPQLLITSGRAHLIFLTVGPDPVWQGCYVPSLAPANGGTASLAVAEFERCSSAKLGAPSHEVWDSHPLFGKGMELYSAQRVVNSTWVKELHAISRFHPLYEPTQWNDLNHYILWFKDSTFECVAKSFKVEVYRESMKTLLSRMVEQLISP